MEDCNSIQFLNQSIFAEIVLNSNTIPAEDVISIWEQLSEHQQQFPRSWAYHVVGTVVLNKNT